MESNIFKYRLFYFSCNSAFCNNKMSFFNRVDKIFKMTFIEVKAFFLWMKSVLRIWYKFLWYRKKCLLFILKGKNNLPTLIKTGLVWHGVTHVYVCVYYCLLFYVLSWIVTDQTVGPELCPDYPEPTQTYIIQIK